MSHFTTLVVVKATDVASAESAAETALIPFDENLDTEPYVKWIDGDELERALEFYRKHPKYCDGTSGPAKPFDEYVTDGNLEAWREWNRQAVGAHNNRPEDGVYDEENDRYGYTSTYNPNSKWDWYSVGGRWAGYFKVHPTALAGTAQGRQSWMSEGPIPADRRDIVRKGDIDFESEREQARVQAEEVFDKVQAVLDAGHEPIKFATLLDAHWAKAEHKRDDDFSTFRPDVVLPELTDDATDNEKENYRTVLNQRRDLFNAPTDAARAEYHSKPFVKAMKEAELLGWFGEPVEDYCLEAKDPRAAYVQSCINNIYVPYSMLVEGHWLQKGQMGWFGMGSNEQDDATWAREVSRLFDRLDDDDWIVAVDCHI